MYKSFMLVWCASNLELRKVSEQSFAAFSPPVSENIDLSKYMKKLVERKILFPVSFQRKVLIKTGKKHRHKTKRKLILQMLRAKLPWTKLTHSFWNQFYNKPPPLCPPPPNFKIKLSNFTVTLSSSQEGEDQDDNFKS